MSSSGGERVHGDTGVPGSRSSHGTPGPSRRGQRAQRSTPARSRSGDLAGKVGVQASAMDFEATLLEPNPAPGDSNQVTLSKDRSPRSESKCPVERSNSGDIGKNARLAKNGSVQQTSVIQLEVVEHRPGIQDPVRPAPPGKPGTMNTPDAPDLPVIPGDSVTPGDSVRLVLTGQEAQMGKNDKALDRTELPVLNSPSNSVQLKHNVHKQQRTMPNLLVEHVSEYTEVGQDFMYSDSSNVKAYQSSNHTLLPHSEHMPPGIGHTGNPLGSCHTGNRSDQEQGSVRTRHHSDVSRSSRRDSNTRHNTIPLQHADPGEHSPASMIRHCHPRSRSRSYVSVSSRQRSRSTSRSRGKKKKSRKRRISSTSSSFSSCRSVSSSSSERERKRHKSKKKKKKHSKHSKSKRDNSKSKKKHKRKRSPTSSPSLVSSSISSDSSSSPRRSPAKKKSRLASRSPSPAGVNPQSVHRAESPASHRDHLSLYADSNDELYSHSEDAQDSAPDNSNPVSENRNDFSQEDTGFPGLIDEVFKLLPSDMFPKKTEEFLGGNRPRSSIELEVGKTTRRNCSLPQSRRPLIQAFQCINESLGASAVDGTFPMPSSITQDWVPSRADIKKLVKVKFYQSHNEFIPTENASALDPDATRLGLSLNGSYPVKVAAIKDLEILARDTIKILSHAEIFSFAAYKALQSEAMDSETLFEILKSMSRAVTDAMSIVTAQTLSLQQLRREAAIELAPKGFLTDEAKRKLQLSSFTSKLLFDGQVASICKNTYENQQLLIRNAVSIQGKPVPSSSSTRKAKSKSGKKKSHAQETPKKDFTFPVPRPPKKSQSPWGSYSRGRGGGPSHRGASARKKN